MNEKDIQNSLAEHLQQYTAQGIYPMHMPGHKRNLPMSIQTFFEKIWELDLTEVEGSDSLHHAKGIIKNAQDYAATVYNAKQSFFLINGSSCGILSAIWAVANPNKSKIIMAKESHMSAYNAVHINRLTPILIPSFPAVGVGGDQSRVFLQAGVDTNVLFQTIQTHHKEACAVFLTSPTYEGVLSDIASIVAYAHRYHLPVIVDEAHGAHLRFFEEFSGISSALSQGADIVVQSVHKTLPALTQTAILHLSKTSQINKERIQESLAIFESSSPSYVLMSSIDLAIRYMAQAKEEIQRLTAWKEEFYARCRAFRYVKIVQEYLIYPKSGSDAKNLDDTYMKNCTDKDTEIEREHMISVRWDSLKVVIYSNQLGASDLANILRKEYCIEPEMVSADYVLCMLTIGDSKEGVERLYLALSDLDQRLEQGFVCHSTLSKKVNLQSLCNAIAKHHIYAFPPDIPIVQRGERIGMEQIRRMEELLNKGIKVFGLDGYGEDIYTTWKERIR